MFGVALGFGVDSTALAEALEAAFSGFTRVENTEEVGAGREMAVLVAGGFDDVSADPFLDSAGLDKDRFSFTGTLTSDCGSPSLAGSGVGLISGATLACS